ncbi:MAG: c-type cytochrome [Gemmatimonadota bacterium]|nr:MAG: c-type cytochrome [Gemmatimonadota bacterium]
MRGILVLALSYLVLIASAGCGGESDAEREARMAAARADSIRMAEEAYDAMVFDTVSWESDNARVQRGAIVWQASCEKCHGAEGRGDGEYAMQLGLEVPSFLEPDWTYAFEVDSLRHRIFVGLEGDMPNWGLHGLGYRNIDAAAGYIGLLVAPQQ